MGKANGHWIFAHSRNLFANGKAGRSQRLSRTDHVRFQALAELGLEELASPAASQNYPMSNEVVERERRNIDSIAVTTIASGVPLQRCSLRFPAWAITTLISHHDIELAALSCSFWRSPVPS